MQHCAEFKCHLYFNVDNEVGSVLCNILSCCTAMIEYDFDDFLSFSFF